jgi:hypothetical protein
VVVGYIRGLAAQAVAPIADWPEQAVAASRAVLASEPDLAHLCLVESQSAGPTIAALVMLASRKIAAGETERLEDLLPDFAEFILAPYLGPKSLSIGSSAGVSHSVPIYPSRERIWERSFSFGNSLLTTPERGASLAPLAGTASNF